MASYTHTCESCGVEMTVHERYYGRALRCRACRAEFVADPAAPGGLSERDRLPPSTTHTCTACGTVMTVTERYYGRSLRCTECGEPFTARIPVMPAALHRPATDAPSAGAETTVVAVAPPRDPTVGPRRARALLVLGAIALSAAALLWWLGGNREQGLGSSLFATEKQRTQIGELRLEGEPTVPVALDRDSFDQLIAAVQSGDRSALQVFRASPRCLSLPAGTRVRVLERRKRGAEARVRVLDGPESSRIVWVPIRWVK